MNRASAGGAPFVLVLGLLFLLPNSSTPADRVPPAGPFRDVAALEPGATTAAGPTSNWTSLGNLTDSLPPAARNYPALAFDAPADEAVLFGGLASSGSALSDTWTYGSNWSWVEEAPSPAPSARWGAAAAYDDALGAVVLFGGETGNGTFLNDTWSFADGGWTELAPSDAPSPRAFASLAPDANSSGLLLFGGLSGAGGLNDTWWFHDGTWSNLTRPSAPAPTPRWQAAMIEDPGISGNLLFGGNGSTPNAFVAFDDTWKFTGAGWSKIAVAQPPVARAGGELAYDGVDRAVVLFGGWAANLGALSGVSEFNGTAWSPSTSALPRPPARYGGGFTELTGFGKGLDLLFGGAGSFGVTATGTWAYASHLPLIVGPTESSVARADPGRSFTLSVYALGGDPPYVYNWSGLPPGCVATKSSPLTCDPVNSGTTFATYSPSAGVRDSAGATGTGTPVEVEISPALAVTQLVLYPSPVGTGGNETIQLLAEGGVPPYGYAFAGLPPGCLSANQSVIDCRPTAAGTYSIRATVADAYGVNVTVTGTLTVRGTSSRLSWIDLGAVGVLIAVVGALLAVWLRGRRARAPPASSGPGAPGGGTGSGRGAPPR